MSTISSRHEFVYLFDVTNGNPNGDPDAGNMPRLDPETNQGLVTDVCLKRKVRNYVELAKDGRPRLRDLHGGARDPERPAPAGLRGLGHLRREEGGLQASCPRTRQGARADRLDVRQLLRRPHLRRGHDAPAYNAGQVRGPVQLAFARSVEPIVPLEISITRMAATTEEDADRQGRQPHHGPQAYRALRPLPRARLRLGQARRAHRLLRATTSSCFWRRCRTCSSTTARPRAARWRRAGSIVFRHDSALGNAPAHKLFERVKVEREATTDDRGSGPPLCATTR